MNVEAADAVNPVICDGTGSIDFVESFVSVMKSTIPTRCEVF